MRLKSGATLVAHMEAEQVSITQLAIFTGCHRSMISHLRSGRKNTCTPALADAIARALRVDTDALFVPRSSGRTRRNVRPRTRVA